MTLETTRPPTRPVTEAPPAGAARPRRGRLVAGALASLLFLLAGAAAFHALSSLKQPPHRVAGEVPPLSVRGEILRRGRYVETLTGYGMVRALEATDVSGEVAGAVIWTAPELEAGSAVAEDQELVRIDPRDFERELDLRRAELDRAIEAEAQAEADLEGRRRQLELAREELATLRAELERIETLSDESVVSANERDRLRRQATASQRVVESLETDLAKGPSGLRAAAADVARARALCERAALDLERTVVRAPFAGLIERRDVAPGAWVAVGTPLFRILDPTRLEVPIALPASRFADVRVGAEARVRLREGGDVVWSGPIERVSPAVDPDERVFHAYVEIDGDKDRPRIAPGAFVVATVNGRVFDDVVAVPRVAFLSERVYVANGRDRDGVAVVEERRPHVLCDLTDVAIVDEGLEDGDVVVTTQVERIAAGKKVRVLVEPGPSR